VPANSPEKAEVVLKDGQGCDEKQKRESEISNRLSSNEPFGVRTALGDFWVRLWIPVCYLTTTYSKEIM